MKLPDFLKKHITPAQWKRLALDDLRRDHRGDVVDLLRNCLMGTWAMGDDKDLPSLLENVQAVCDELRGPEKSTEGQSDVFQRFAAIQQGRDANAETGVSESGQISPLRGLFSARDLCRSARVPFPPVPQDLEPLLKEQWPSCYTTRPLRMRPYNLQALLDELPAYSGGDYAVLAQDGHGINSYALHYYLVRGPLKLFLQKSFGGIYGDPVKQSEDIRKAFELAERLQAAVEAAPSDSPALDGGLLVVESDLYGSYLGPANTDSWRNLRIAWGEGSGSVMEKALDLLARNEAPESAQSGRKGKPGRSSKRRRK